MKNCDYCGRENVDDVKYCSECGTEIAAEKEAVPPIIPREDKSAIYPPVEEIPRQVSRRVAMGTFVAMCTCAVLCVSANPKGVILLPAFPCGLLIFLAAFFQSKDQTNPSYPVLGILLVVSYGIYVIFFLAFLRARKWKEFGILCFIFALLLLLNVSGCKGIVKGLSNIN